MIFFFKSNQANRLGNHRKCEEIRANCINGKEQEVKAELDEQKCRRVDVVLVNPQSDMTHACSCV